MSIVNQNIQNVQETINKMPTMMNTVKLDKTTNSAFAKKTTSRSSQRGMHNQNSSLSAAGQAMMQNNTNMMNVAVSQYSAGNES